MAKTPNSIPVSVLRRDPARVFGNARSSDEPVFITRRGHAEAVLMSIDAFERSVSEREILRLLARGATEIDSRIGHRLQDVLAEADKLLR